jgi:hypothetical protein
MESNAGDDSELNVLKQKMNAYFEEVKDHNDSRSKCNGFHHQQKVPNDHERTYYEKVRALLNIFSIILTKVSRS